MRSTRRNQNLKWHEPPEYFDREVDLEERLYWNPAHVMGVIYLVGVLVFFPVLVAGMDGGEKLGAFVVMVLFGGMFFFLPEKKGLSYQSVVEMDGDGIFVRRDSGIWFSRFVDLTGYVIRDHGTHRTLVLFLSSTQTHTIGLSKKVSNRDLENALARGGVPCMRLGRHVPESHAVPQGVGRGTSTIVADAGLS